MLWPLGHSSAPIIRPPAIGVFQTCPHDGQLQNTHQTRAAGERRAPADLQQGHSISRRSEGKRLLQESRVLEYRAKPARSQRPLAGIVGIRVNVSWRGRTEPIALVREPAVRPRHRSCQNAIRENLGDAETRWAPSASSRFVKRFTGLQDEQSIRLEFWRSRRLARYAGRPAKSILVAHNCSGAYLLNCSETPSVGSSSSKFSFGLNRASTISRPAPSASSRKSMGRSLFW